MVWNKKKKSPHEQAEQDYKKLGQQVVDLYEMLRPNRVALYRTAFLKGIFTGVGGVIGATVIIALLIWVLSLFNNVPLIGGFMESIQNTLEEQ